MKVPKGLRPLLEKDRFDAVGLMSGTSMDGVDAALISIDSHPESPKIELKGFASLDYPAELREALEEIAIGKETTAEEIATVNTGVGVTFSGSFFQVCRRAGFEPENVDFIGSHGQTVAHVPPRASSGNPISGTLQLGSPTIIAALTGVTTVGDFRTGDVAVGGQGAPLVPFADYLLRRDKASSRVILNIGGIANLTFLPKDCTREDVFAFDTGPGNMVIDALYRVLYHGKGRYDENGAKARRGKSSAALVDEFIQDAFFEMPPPKSAGHHEFGAPFAWQFKTRGDELGLSRDDVLASAVALTTRTIADAVDGFVRPRGKIDSIYISGGGTHNQAIVEGLFERLGGLGCHSIEELGIPADAKEAVDFAVLARETLMCRPNVLTTATGASRALVLGAIAPGSNL